MEKYPFWQRQIQAGWQALSYFSGTVLSVTVVVVLFSIGKAISQFEFASLNALLPGQIIYYIPVIIILLGLAINLLRANWDRVMNLSSRMSFIKNQRVQALLALFVASAHFGYGYGIYATPFAFYLFVVGTFFAPLVIEFIWTDLNASKPRDPSKLR
jgi:hypothetical protein